MTASPRRLCVLHHRQEEWVPALRQAEPRLDIRGWHPRAWRKADPVWVSGAEGLFCWRIPAGFLAGMPQLAWVQNSGAGVDHLLSDSGIPAGVPITRADGQFGFWIARYVLAHLLAEAQLLPACREAQARGEWNPRLIPEDLWGAQALVLGFGRIGRQIGRALREVGMTVSGIVRSPRPDPEFPLAGREQFSSLLAGARLLVLAAPSTPETRCLVDAALLAKGNGRLTLINVGRGDLLDPEEVLAALDAGTLGHAVLDVFPEEPLPVDSPLWRHPQVTVTPHHSGPSTPRALIPDILDNLRRFAEGRPIEGAVDLARGY
jgi:glyoxylate/hydroxypyruvate reductase